jgi:hypothetical protein
MALDMGLYRCLPYLVRTGMGSDKSPEQLEEERALVVGARVWLTVSAITRLILIVAIAHGQLFKMEYE